MNFPHPHSLPVLSLDRIHAAPRVSAAALRVLLVDDDTFQLDYVSEVLFNLGLRDITAVGSGERALQLLADQQLPMDLLLLDLAMPGADGFPFFEAVAQTGFTGAMILMSGQSEEVLRSATLLAQLRRFSLLGSVTKPLCRVAFSVLLDRME